MEDFERWGEAQGGGVALISEDKLSNSVLTLNSGPRKRIKIRLLRPFWKETSPLRRSRTPPLIDRTSRDQLHLHFVQTNLLWCPTFSGAQAALGQLYGNFPWILFQAPFGIYISSFLIFSFWRSVVREELGVCGRERVELHRAWGA